MRIARIGMLLAVATALLAGCGREDAQAMEITADDYSFSGVGETIAGGTIDITFRNAGEAEHELAFMDIGDTDYATFAKEFPTVLQGGPFPKFIKAMSLAGEVEPGRTIRTKMTLPKGEYMLFCALDDAPGDGEETGKPHYELGMRQEVSVEGPDEAELDTPAERTFAARDYTFDFPDTVQAGEQEYGFVNEGPKQWHFMGLMAYPEGTTVEQAEAAFATMLTLEEGQEPPAGTPMGEEAYGTGIFSPGRGQTFTYDFEAGRTYLAACFIQDLAGGPPHAVGHKMYKAFTVQG